MRALGSTPSTGGGPGKASNGAQDVDAGTVARKLASRVFQRAVTPDEDVKHGTHARQDLGVDPAAKKVSDFVKGQVKGRTYDRAKSALLTRLASGFGLALPGMGLYFAGRGVWKGAGRVSEELGRDRRAAAGWLGASVTADAVNMIAQVGGLGKAMRDSSLHWPGIHDNPLVWWSDSLGLPTGLPLTLALLSTLFGAMGEVRVRYDSVRQFLMDKVPAATQQAEQAVNKVVNGEADLSSAAREAVSAANTAVEEGLPDLTSDPQEKGAVGKAAARELGVPTQRAAEVLNEAARKAAEELERRAKGGPSV